MLWPQNHQKFQSFRAKKTLTTQKNFSYKTALYEVMITVRGIDLGKLNNLKMQPEAAQIFFN